MGSDRVDGISGAGKVQSPCAHAEAVRRFDTLDCAAAQLALNELLNEVAGGCGRVEINGSAPNARCVLISAAELHSLEQALEILSATDGANAMREQITSVAAAAGAHQALVQTPSINVLSAADATAHEGVDVAVRRRRADATNN